MTQLPNGDNKVGKTIASDIEKTKVLETSEHNNIKSEPEIHTNALQNGCTELDDIVIKQDGDNLLDSILSTEIQLVKPKLDHTKNIEVQNQESSIDINGFNDVQSEDNVKNIVIKLDIINSEVNEVVKTCIDNVVLGEKKV